MSTETIRKTMLLVEDIENRKQVLVEEQRAVAEMMSALLVRHGELMFALMGLQMEAQQVRSAFEAEQSSGTDGEGA